MDTHPSVLPPPRPGWASRVSGGGSPFLSRLVLALLGATVSLVLEGGPGRLDLGRGWKFQEGDRLSYKDPGFDDSAWEAMAPGSPWERQGHPKLYGLAWYRLRFTLPDGMRRQDAFKEGVKLFLGRIGDCDQTFLNGELIGTEGTAVAPGTAPDPNFPGVQDSYRTQDRSYVLPATDPRLRWGAENVLALRVRQTDDEGGLLSLGQSLAMAGPADLVAVDALARPFVFKGHAPAKTFQVVNRAARHTLHGALRIQGRGAVTGQRALDLTLPLDLPPGASRTCSFSFPPVEESVTTTYALRLGRGPWLPVGAESSPYLLTPEPGAAPRINNPTVLGAGQGHPVLFSIPVTGQRPLTFEARGLPAGLALDGTTGLLRGSVAAPGTYPVSILVRNARGEARGTLVLKIGQGLALTPPMGWNSWNCWGLAVDEEKVVASARTFVAKGLRDHGWSYVNIDDGWEIPEGGEHPRDSQGRIMVNAKFPDMARLGSRLHDLGLKFGIYSSPGPLTCGHHTGSWQHEGDDAQSYAAWGVDYLKYDWCSYGRLAKDRSRPELMKPYQVMGGALGRVDRDIVFSLCQYGMGNVWEWGASVGGQLWRTTGDIEDSWDSLKGTGFRQVESAPFAGPGHWNDPDMLVVGQVGWGAHPHASRLTPDEQYTHMSLWCMQAAPLLIGCDLAALDAFTLNLLTNDEVLAIDQDPLGKQATPVLTRGDLQVWVKPLADGARAIAVFNLGPAAAPWAPDLKALGVPDGSALRDLWRQRRVENPGDLVVPAHGVVLLRASRP